MSDVIADPYPRSNRHLISRIRLIEGDLTAQRDVDAIVASVPVTLDMGRSLNQAIIKAAGPELDEFLLEHLFKPRAGDVLPVPSFGLGVQHLLYVVTPEWRAGIEHEDRDLVRCYRGAMQMARHMGLKRIAFPALGTGAHKYPVKRAARLGLQGIMDRLDAGFHEVRIVCNRAETYDAFHEWLVHYGWEGNAPPSQAASFKNSE
ncbi:MAG: macro domain-containing protein [Micavibrio aeruginosavorus]|nr:macro domain-containing protein [Micavibrio aeruginosavorus]